MEPAYQLAFPFECAQPGRPMQSKHTYPARRGDNLWWPPIFVHSWPARSHRRDCRCSTRTTRRAQKPTPDTWSGLLTRMMTSMKSCCCHCRCQTSCSRCCCCCHCWCHPLSRGSPLKIIKRSGKWVNEACPLMRCRSAAAKTKRK